MTHSCSTSTSIVTRTVVVPFSVLTGTSIVCGSGFEGLVEQPASKATRIKAANNFMGLTPFVLFDSQYNNRQALSVKNCNEAPKCQH